MEIWELRNTVMEYRAAIEEEEVRYGEWVARGVEVVEEEGENGENAEGAEGERELAEGEENPRQSREYSEELDMEAPHSQDDEHSLS